MIKNPYRAAGTYNGISYVERDADRALLKSIMRNSRYPYLLAPRQSGKSSLIAHTISKLERERIQSFFIDLSAFPPDCLQSYDLFLKILASELTTQIPDFDNIRTKSKLENILRFIAQEIDQRTVIFIDEIDFLLKANYKDSFFGLIRSFFNRRAREPEFEKIQFILAGAARPTQLISNKNVSPFNVGDPISMADLSFEEVVIMVECLRNEFQFASGELERKIYEYTNGSVYLTQLVLEKLWNLSIDNQFSFLQIDIVDKVVQAIVDDAPNNIHFLNIYSSIVEDSKVLKAFSAFYKKKLIEQEELETLKIIGITDGKNLYKNLIYRRIFGADGSFFLNKKLEADDFDELVQQVRVKASEKVRHLYSKIRLLNLRQIEVDQLYVDVYILKELTGSTYVDISTLLKSFNPENDRFALGSRAERIPGLEVANKHSKLMVLGKPGSGKSTFLRYLAVACCKGEFQSDKIPVLLELRTIVDWERFDLVQLLHEEFGLADKSQTKRIIDSGKVLLLLDGLDEVTDRSREIIQNRIQKFSKNYYRNWLILTSRTQVSGRSLDGFEYIEVADFNQNQVEQFAYNWFISLAEVPEQGVIQAKSFICNLNRPENRQTAELTTTPVLLSLACWVFQDLADFPQRQIDLYRYGVELLLSQWDESRGLRRESGSYIYRQLSVEDKQRLLGNIAIRKFKKEQFALFEQEEIQNYIAEYLAISLKESQEVLKSIEVQHGLLIERASAIYSFSHRVFQEYFAVRELWKRSTQQYKIDLQTFVSVIRSVQVLEDQAISANLQQKVERILSGHPRNEDLQALASIVQAKQVVLSSGERSVAIGGNVSDSVIVTGDNNVIAMKGIDIVTIGRISQQWGKYVQPNGCQNWQECDRYLEAVLHRLEQLGNPEILKNENLSGRRFNCIVKMIEFEPGLGMRGEAFFLFSEFAILSANALQQFSAQCLQIAKNRVDPDASGRAFYNFRVPIHFCFAIALVDQLDDATGIAVRTTNPFKQRVDMLWYEVPVVYELNRQQLYYYDKAAGFWENFRGEIVWQKLRSVIQQVLMPV